MAKHLYKKGNPSKLKYNTVKLRREVFQALLQHLRDGYGVSCFPLMKYDQIQYYLATFPKEFDNEEYEAAIRQGQLTWERIGKGGVMGKIKGFNGGCYRFMMMNKYNWSYNVGADANQSPPQKLVIEYASKKNDEPEAA